MYLSNVLKNYPVFIFLLSYTLCIVTALFSHNKKILRLKNYCSILRHVTFTVKTKVCCKTGVV